MSKLQKLATTNIFRALLGSYMSSGIMYIYYFEVFHYVVFTAIFTRLSVKFKFFHQSDRPMGQRPNQRHEDRVLLPSAILSPSRDCPCQRHAPTRAAEELESSAFSRVWAEGLFLCYSVLVVVILLNILIAIVSDSYDAVLVTSTELFWHSRLELVAELTTTFSRLLKVDLEIRNWFENQADLVLPRLKILFGLDDDHSWSNRKGKVALGLRLLFSPILLKIGIVS
ncbi:hypothetical protein TrLO_g12289 [Triparma laevis f. longispina]|uniref:Ion transport domain-containing protein n=1 Tax=Triparma laevis f. longispina TaxID=1714387 RepID=A0A9W7KYD3_9STRA|nr:hypothetical protein TrLO_g12289 [Triparma laevis f. longispina]